MTKINNLSKRKPRIHESIRGGEPEYHADKKGERSLETGRSPDIWKKRSRFVPKGIDPAYPQKNFVYAHYENKGDKEGFWKYMHGDTLYKFPFGGTGTEQVVRQKAHGFGHDHKRGALRLSGHKGAHRIGKR